VGQVTEIPVFREPTLTSRLGLTPFTTGLQDGESGTPPQLCTPEQAQRVEEPAVQWGAGLILVATLYR
jgi:hypothetical protein